MWNKAFLKAPPVLCVLVMVLFSSILLIREASNREGLPDFFPTRQNFVSVEIHGDGLAPGVYQFNDGFALSDVIKLTGLSAGGHLTNDPLLSLPLKNGEIFQLVKKGRRIESLHRGWMPASHRLAMAIPLHPDRMSASDWSVLPGVGSILAERIEKDRQENGDYGSLSALMRVKGIGKKRVDSWRKLFDGI